MDWTLPDRPRRLVTYGKNARSRTARSQASQFSKEQNSNDLTARRSGITPPPRSLRESAIEDTAHAKSPSQDGRSSVRSPKRRKLTPVDDDDDEVDLIVVSPRPQTRRGPAAKPTYTRKDVLRRSVSDLPNNSHLARSIDSRLSISPDRSSDRPVTSSARSITRTQADLGITPLRRRLVDALGFENVQEGSSGASDSEHESSQQQGIDIFKSRETTPVAGDFQTSYNTDSQTSSKWSQRTQEIIEASPQSGSPRVTYARQRSFLRNIDIHGNSSGDPAEDFSASLLSMPLHPVAKDDTETSQTESSGTISSIHELRRAGVNARFQGLVDSILEDIEDRSSSSSVRRSGLVQLCEKLLDDKFAPRFVEIGGFERLTKCMSPRADLILALLSVYACALVLRLNHLPSTVWTSAWSKLIILAPTLLPVDDSVTKLVSQRRYSLSRVNQASIRDIASQFVRVSGLDEQESSKLSPCHLLLRCLYLTVRKVREKDIAGTIPGEVVSQLVEILLELTQKATDRDTSENFVLIESIITILEIYTTTSDITGQAQQDVLLPLTKSSHLLSSLSRKSDPQDIQLLTLLLRLILNITNASFSLCENFATPEVIHGLTVIVLSNYDTASRDFVIDEKKDSLDIVILALGALINLTEVSEAARQNILNQEEDSQSLFEQLLSIFTRGLDSVSEADSVVQTHSNVAFGYLSILLCTLCLEREAYATLKSAMKGTGLARLLATVEEFLHYHRKVDEELQQSQSVKEFTVRLQRILNQIRAISTCVT
ncbi:hypothetical protein TSTA_121680 [Talaromyces stipitatus ATCC 10500]|uniref:Wings apart-like protein C-terminal domain-containing protein n=1 Tax=Talaromyces stipitatus (strain ATCC 10500 / CBS 375.48 / QM 6759 / NRRL 1006) TaxID=441959 RepID=B8MBY2_TALSN|nr:uncharacterized protein TSTA_121680 [Talaromyces stipitatus ATCC 10500]EED18428.1 hypothetical protein TSTA_121680 [Talaromyces stipitatus ATCC 10500]